MAVVAQQLLEHSVALAAAVFFIMDKGQMVLAVQWAAAAAAVLLGAGVIAARLVQMLALAGTMAAAAAVKAVLQLPLRLLALAA